MRWPAVISNVLTQLNSIAAIPGKSLTNGLLLRRQTKRAAVTTPDECLTSYEAFVSRTHNRLIQTESRAESISSFVGENISLMPPPGLIKL